MIEYDKPFKRIMLPGVVTHYIEDNRYSSNIIEQKRMINLLEKELIDLFEYIEPSKDNLQVYSLKLYQLFVKISIEFENMCKIILKDNIYNKNNNLTILDYKKLNKIMQLDKYICTIDLIDNIKFKPFEDWKKDDNLKWYQDYNKLKHNRTVEFPKASLYNVLISFSALRVLLFAQYGNFSLDTALTPLSTLQFTKMLLHIFSNSIDIFTNN